jgi:hypothetical protein
VALSVGPMTNAICLFPFAYLDSTQRFSQGCARVCNAFVAPKHYFE